MSEVSYSVMYREVVIPASVLQEQNVAQGGEDEC